MMLADDVSDLDAARLERDWKPMFPMTQILYI